MGRLAVRLRSGSLLHVGHHGAGSAAARAAAASSGASAVRVVSLMAIAHAVAHQAANREDTSASTMSATTTVDGVNSKPNIARPFSEHRGTGPRGFPRARSRFAYATLPSASSSPATLSFFLSKVGMGRKIWNSMPARTTMATTVHTLKPISPVSKPPNW